MAQVKVYGLRTALDPVKHRLSDAIHAAVVEALSFPVGKRAHRFFPLAADDFYRPAGRTERYTIVEVSMFEGRSPGAKRALIHGLFRRIETEVGISARDVEITITETPRSNWGFRGMTGDDVELDYKVKV